MTPASCKAKGRNLQNMVCDTLRTLYQCHPDDIRPAIMGESGEDIKIGPAMRKRFPYSVECKNQERISIWEALSQAENHARIKKTVPALIFHRNRSKTWVAIPLEDWVALLSVLDASREAV